MTERVEAENVRQLNALWTVNQQSMQQQKQLQAENAELRSSVESATEHAKTLRHKLDEVGEQHEELRRTRAELQQLRTKNVSLEQSSESKIHKLEKSLKEKKTLAETNSAKLAEAQDALAGTQTTLDEIKANNMMLRDALQSKDTQIEHIALKLKRTKNENERLKNREEQLQKSQEAALAQAEKKQKSLEETISRLREQNLERKKEDASGVHIIFPSIRGAHCGLVTEDSARSSTDSQRPKSTLKKKKKSSSKYKVTESIKFLT